LAKSLVKAGIAGSSGLPNVAQASTEILEGTKFTVIGNAGAVEMAKEGST
jgi:oxidoreductase